MCLGNNSGDFSANNMKKTELDGCVCNISLNYRAFDSTYIIDIHEYLMKIHGICVLLSNRKCITLPSSINLNPNEYIQKLHYYPFVVKLDRYTGSCSTLKSNCYIC